MIVATSDAFDHRVLCLYGEGALTAEARAVATVTALGARRPRDIIRRMRWIVQWIQGEGAAVVHTQLPRADVVGGLAAALAGRVPLLTTLQNSHFTDRAQNSDVPARWRVPLAFALRTIGRLARARYIAVSESVRESYLHDVGLRREHIRVIYNSVTPSSLRRPHPGERASVRSGLALPPDCRVLLTVARHVPQKGLDVLIESLGHVRDLPILAVLIGSGPMTKRLQEQVARCSLTNQVLFAGARSDVDRWLRAADIFVLSSRFEGLSVALLEALAAGLPVIASDLPEIREVTGSDAALLVPPGDAVALAHGIRRQLENDHEAAAFAACGQRRIEERFTVATNAPRFAATVRSVAAGAWPPADD